MRYYHTLFPIASLTRMIGLLSSMYAGQQVARLVIVTGRTKRDFYRLPNGLPLGIGSYTSVLLSIMEEGDGTIQPPQP